MSLRQSLSACARACGAAVLSPLVRQPSSPWLPIAVYGPLAVACLLGNLRAEPPAWAWIVLPAGGFLLWTLVEYVLHSRFFHEPPRGFRWVSLSHGNHHDAPDDPAVGLGVPHRPPRRGQPRAAGADAGAVGQRPAVTSHLTGLAGSPPGRES